MNIRALKRYLLTGFIIVAPISITLFLLLSFISIVDYLLGPIAYTVLGRQIPGIGVIVAFFLLLLAGIAGSNIRGQHILDWIEDVFLHIPVVNWLYSTVKQLTDVFSPGGKMHFQSVVMIEYPRPGVYSLGFVTNDIEAHRPDGTVQRMCAVYIATNHLYIGDLVLVPEDKVLTTPMTLQEGVQCFLSAGAAIPRRLNLETKKPGSSTQENPGIST
ncbi:MAG: DUF502 domain-containing protein [Elusimicrobiota bacterium]